MISDSGLIFGHLVYLMETYHNFCSLYTQNLL